MLGRVFSILLLIAAAVLIFFTSASLADRLPKQDFAQYWAAARLINQNPYSQELTYDLERHAGMPVGEKTLVIPNPPWALPLVLPLRVFSYRSAFALWTLFTIVAVATCGRVLWSLFTPTPSLEPAFISLLFGPTLVILMLGQFAVLGLIGATGCLYCLHRGNNWLAGIFLLLLFAKPHLVLPFLFVLLLSTISKKQWGLILGATLALLAASAVALILNHHVFQQYVDYSHRFTTEKVPYPNLGGILFLITRRHFLALAPINVALIWSVLYWRRNSNQDVAALSPLLLLVGVVCAYYSYSYDEILGLPALLYLAAKGNRRIFWAGFVLVETGYVLYFANFGAVTGLDYMFLSWISLAMLCTYLLAAPRNQSMAVTASAT